MSIRIIRERTVTEGVSYDLCFWYEGHEHNWGYCFPCDEHGNVNEEKLIPIALQNLKDARQGTINGKKVLPPKVRKTPFRQVEPAIAECERCKQKAPRNNYCGAFVCTTCNHHQGLARCFCGWSLYGNNGYQELLDMGENVEEMY